MKTPGGLLSRTLREYVESCGLHGVRYLGEKGRPWTERLLWTLGLLLSLLCISFLILKSWQQWTQSPVLVSFADEPSSIWDIPFPTITVCPPNKYRKKVFDMSQFWEADRTNMSERDRRLMNDLMLVCNQLEQFSNNFNDFPLLTDDVTLQNLIEIAPTLYESVECANIMDVTNQSRCDRLLDTVVTREGVCFTYNALPRDGIHRHDERQIWTLQNGYDRQSGFWDIPRRPTGAGYLQGIILGLKSNHSELDYTCRPLQGFKISFGSPADFPRPMNQYYFAPISGFTQMAVSPHVTDTEDALKSYSPDQRHCYFPSERRLSYFSTYTQGNCDLECLANHTVRVCGCVDFYMPHNTSTPICGLRSTSCTKKAEQALTREIIDEKIHQRKSKYTCDCLPSCKTIEFTAELSQMGIDTERVKKYLGIDQNESYRNVEFNYVYIFMKDSEFRPLLRRELYGVTSFIATCGGLLGLCCGFSLLSILELVYFFTVRLWNNFTEANAHKRKRRVHVEPFKVWVNSRPFYLQ